MRTVFDANRYRATPELRRQFLIQGRQASWAARQVGVSKSQMSRIMSGRRSLDESAARLLAAMLGIEFGLLFEVPVGYEEVSSGLERGGCREERRRQR